MGGRTPGSTAATAAATAPVAAPAPSRGVLTLDVGGGTGAKASASSSTITIVGEAATRGAAGMPLVASPTVETRGRASPGTLAPAVEDKEEEGVGISPAEPFIAVATGTGVVDAFERADADLMTPPVAEAGKPDEEPTVAGADATAVKCLGCAVVEPPETG